MKLSNYFLLGMCMMVFSQACGDFEFTLATCNVLYEPYYIKNAPDKKNRMKLQDRAKIFEDALNKPEAFVGVDIYCFQEWPYSGTGSQEFNQVVDANLIARGYEKIEPQQNNYKTADNELIVFNSNKFKKIAYGFEPFNDPKNPAQKLKNKGIMYAVLEDKISQYLVIVMNVHVPWQPLPPRDQNKLDPLYEASLLEIMSVAQTISNMEVTGKKILYNNNTIWTLCGDFNFDTWDTNRQPYYGLLSKYLNNNFGYFVGLKITDTHAISFQTPTSFSDRYQYNDYIFYDISDFWVTPSIYPSDPEELIRHKQNPAEAARRGGDFFRNYFSDHAIIKAKFTLKAAGPAPDKPGDDKALIDSLNSLSDSLNGLARSLE